MMAQKLQQGCDDYAYLLTTGVSEWAMHVISLEHTFASGSRCVRKDSIASYRIARYLLAYT